MSYLNKKAIREATFTPKEPDVLPDSIKAYTILVKEVDAEDEAAYAKDVVKDGVHIYYIKTGKGRFYNPVGIYTEYNDKNAYKGLKHWTFTRVSKKVFGYYLRFLETRNPVWLNHAERENS